MIRWLMAALAAKAWPDLAMPRYSRRRLSCRRPAPGQVMHMNMSGAFCHFFRMVNPKPEARGHIQGVYSHICGTGFRKEMAPSFGPDRRNWATGTLLVEGASRHYTRQYVLMPPTTAPSRPVYSRRPLRLSLKKMHYMGQSVTIHLMDQCTVTHACAWTTFRPMLPQRAAAAAAYMYAVVLVQFVHKSNCKRTKKNWQLDWTRD